ncbi:unnamed protein product [Sphenostylis stenocarpa]|uniref:Uncharacterized protein n=1 Tax=Sphenostylis stenocarpa TaxID=92480 RepID=A0AA86SQC7_9FABA|nr:unnamed protein product [Sphenostylis stenocarpa]
MREWDVELLFPLRVLGVLLHSHACHRRLRHLNRHVRAIRDDPPVVARLLASTVGGDIVRVEFDCVISYTATKTLREDVHVRQLPRLDDFQIKVTMNIDDAIVIIAGNDHHGKCARYPMH